MVADINTDMFLPIIPLKLLTVYGLAESDLGDDITEVAQKNGVEVQPDPEPLRNLFIRKRATAAAVEARKLLPPIRS